MKVDLILRPLEKDFNPFGIPYTELNRGMKIRGYGYIALNGLTNPKIGSIKSKNIIIHISNLKNNRAGKKNTSIKNGK